MGLLDKLWDDTVAGPPPEAGLGRLRRHPTFSSSVRSVLRQQEEELALIRRRQKATDLDEADAAVTVTRSITIVRPPPSFRNTDSGSPSLPSSPAGDDSPFTPRTPRGGEWGERQRKTNLSEAFEPRSPTVYDWVVISSLDR